MLCNNCGYDIGNSPFCSHCGTPATQAQQRQQLAKPCTPTPTPPHYTPPQPSSQPQRGSHGTLIAVIIAIIAIIAILAIVVIMFFGGDDNKSFDKNSDPEDCITDLLEKYGNSVTQCDADLYLGIYPDAAEEYILDMFGSKNDIEEDLEDELAFFEDKYGENIEFEFEADSIDELDDDEIDEIEEYLDDLYGDMDDIDTAYNVEYTINVEGDDDSDSSSSEVVIIVVDGEYFFTEE